MEKAEFINAIKNWDSHLFASIVYEVDPKLLKKSRTTKVPNPFVGIRKLAKLVIGVGNFSYSTGVNNRLEKEGKDANFVAGDLPWGSWMSGSNSLIEHKGNVYFRAYTNYANNPIVSKFLDSLGNVVPKETLSNYLPAESENTNQGLENPVRPININIDNIKYFKCGEIEYGQFSDAMKAVLELE